MASDSDRNMAVQHLETRLFANVTDDYEFGRPTPDVALLSILASRIGLDEKSAILELGAGTGKLTRLLVAFGLDVIATEPLGTMRDFFRQVLPDTPILAGSAEAIPVSDQCADVVIAADAFHWFDADSTHSEILRVLRPGGWVVCLTNSRAAPSLWHEQLEELLNKRCVAPLYQDLSPHGRWLEITKTSRFVNHELFEFDQAEPYGVARLLALVNSFHFVQELDQDRRAALLKEIERHTWAGLHASGRRTVEILFTVHVAIAQLA